MNNLNNKSKQTASTLDKARVQTRGRTIEVKLAQKVSAAAKLSSRPSRSILKAKSLTKPCVSPVKKNSEAKNF